MRFLIPLMFLAAPALAKDAPYYGEPPNDPALAIRGLENEVKNRLKDPYSAQFAWPNGFARGSYRPVFRRRIDGWITCGTVNAKNSFGGYIGARTVLGIVTANEPLYVEIDDNSNFGINTGPASEACAKLGM